MSLGDTARNEWEEMASQKAPDARRALQHMGYRARKA